MEPEFRKLVVGYTSRRKIDQRTRDTLPSPGHRGRLYKDWFPVNPDKYGNRVDEKGQERREIAS